MCIFCKIVNGEIPSYKVYEDNDFLAFLDITQATIGHTLVVPKKHFDNVFQLETETAGNLFKLVTKLSKQLQKALEINDLNILNNSGALAGQTINHFHIHLIPRYQNDQMVFYFAHNKLSNEEFSDLLKKING